MQPDLDSRLQAMEQQMEEQRRRFEACITAEIGLIERMAVTQEDLKSRLHGMEQQMEEQKHNFEADIMAETRRTQRILHKARTCAYTAGRRKKKSSKRLDEMTATLRQSQYMLSQSNQRIAELEEQVTPGQLKANNAKNKGGAFRFVFPPKKPAQHVRGASS